jgi:hypothetical protein
MNMNTMSTSNQAALQSTLALVAIVTLIIGCIGMVFALVRSRKRHRAHHAATEEFTIPRINGVLLTVMIIVSICSILVPAHLVTIRNSEREFQGQVLVSRFERYYGLRDLHLIDGGDLADIMVTESENTTGSTQVRITYADIENRIREGYIQYGHGKAILFAYDDYVSIFMPDYTEHQVTVSM